MEEEMFKGEEIRAIESLDTMTNIIKSELENITDGFISVGYHLKMTRDDQLYTQKGYASLYEYAKDTFGISRFTATRFMEINDKYSMGGNSPQIDDRWRGYGSSKLTEMLGLPEEIQEVIPAEATVREIRDAKAIVKETESRYDDQMELCDIAQETEQEPWMRKLVKEFFRSDGKDKFQTMVDFVRKDIGNDQEGIEEEILAIINPTKFKMIQLDTANVMMQEKIIQVMPYRGQGEKEKFTYVDFDMAFEELFYPNYPDISQPINEIYRAVYGVPYYEEAKHEEKPEKQEKKTEKKPAGNTKPVPKHEPTPVSKMETPGEVAQTLGNPRVPEDPEKGKPEKIEKKEPENSEQIPGQTEITKDFPEYCPDNIGIMNQPEETVVESHYGSRKDFLDAAEEYKAAKYMAEAMQEFIDKKISAKSLVNEKFWKKWLNAEVDESGKEIETI